MPYHSSFFFFFFNDTATTEIYTLSLHDALPISRTSSGSRRQVPGMTPSPATPGASSLASHSICMPRHTPRRGVPRAAAWVTAWSSPRSEEHTSELQSLAYLVCRLLLEKKKNREN